MTGDIPIYNWSLVITVIADGGFVVSDIPSLGSMRTDLFACSTIDEALNYVKEKFSAHASLRV